MTEACSFDIGFVAIDETCVGNGILKVKDFENAELFGFMESQKSLLYYTVHH